MNFTAIVQIAMMLFKRRDDLAKVLDIAKEIMAAIQPNAQQAQAMKVGSAEVGSMSWLQESLNTLTNAGLTVDGGYGPKTNAAVNAFQKARGLTADGWAGPETIAKITEELMARVPVRT